MENTKLTWEDIQHYKRINEHNIYEHQGKLYYAREEGTVATTILVYSLPHEYYDLLKAGEKSMDAIYTKLRYGVWPDEKGAQNIIDRKIAEDRPTYLILRPTIQQLFSKKELGKLLPIAEKQWTRFGAPLPDNYLSSLKKD